MAAVGKSSEPEITELPAGNGEEEEKATGDREESMEDEDFTVQLGATYSCKRQDGTYHDAKVTKTRMNKRAGREEFYVQYVGLNSRQNEWVDKTRLVLVDQMEEEEDVEDDMDEETSANDNSQLEKKTEEDEPVSKKPKVEIQEASTSSSVVDAEDFAEDLTCPLCNKLFNDPVVVECGHNFCHSCIDQAWEGQDSFTCPDCKEVITDKRYTNNRILANLVKKTVGLPFGALLHSPTAGLTPAKSLVKEKPQPTANCLMHDERLKLFCKDDGDLACVICRESLKHATHNFLPILDAMGVYREELSSIVNPLEEALKMAEQLAKQQNEKIERHTANMLEYRAHIEAEFEKMHKLLKEREEQLLGKLQAEGGTLLMEMEANVAKLQENIDCIKKSIASASEKLDDKDSISFLTDIKAFIKKCQEQQEEALSSGSSIIDRQLNRETYMAPINFSVTEGLKITPTQNVWLPYSMATPPADLHAIIQTAVQEALVAKRARKRNPIISHEHSDDCDTSQGKEASPPREGECSSQKRPKRKSTDRLGDAHEPPAGVAEDHDSRYEFDMPSLETEGTSVPQCSDPMAEDKVFNLQGEAMFDPRAIKHPHSLEWSPPDHIARYVQVWLRKPLDRDVRNKLRAECPRPVIPGKVTATPEFDHFLISFLQKKGRDPRKGLEKGLKSVQDKLLDLSGPLTRMLMLADAAFMDKSFLETAIVRQLAQHSICLLGNANAALSTERRRSALLRIDPKLADLAEQEPGYKADGKLFGDSFISELREHMTSLTHLTEMQSSLKIFQTSGFFPKAGRPRSRGARRRLPPRGPHQHFQVNPAVSKMPFPRQRGSPRGGPGSSRDQGSPSYA